MDVEQAFQDAPYETRKHTSYFAAYESLFSRYRGGPITFVEIGVLNGGSLFMWRSFFGQKARIIGVDLNPNTKQWEEYGFEIRIGNQADPVFWSTFFEEIGPIDILLDDGGHTFEQQIITCGSAIPWIKDGGILVVEDTHTSYMPPFGGPSRRSFVSFAKNVVDGINFRSGMLPNSQFEREIASVTFYESIVAFHVDRSIASKKSSRVVNTAKNVSAADYRYADSNAARSIESLPRRYSYLKQLPGVGAILRKVWRVIRRRAYGALSRARAQRARRYFKY